MDGWVACTECGTRYDAATFSFCPSCGSTKQASTQPGEAAVVPPSAHPRRLQAGGAILLLIGLLGCAVAGYALGPGASEVEHGVGALLEAQPENVPGGTVLLHTTMDGRPVMANLTLTAGGVVVAYASTDVNGSTQLPLGRHGAVRLAAEAGGHTVERDLFVLEGNIMTLRLDVVQDAPGPSWVGLGPVLQAGLGLLFGLAALLGIGGLSALLRRMRWVALIAPAPALALSLFAATGGLSLGAWAIALTLGLAYALVVSGRGAFR